MTPLEAIKLLETVTSQIATSRDGHLKLIEAIGVLKQALGQTNGKS